METNEKYAAFENSCLRLRLRPKVLEVCVHGKGWIDLTGLEVGDLTNFGRVAFIGTLDEVQVYQDKYARP